MANDERAAMLSAPLTAKEREALIAYAGFPDECDACRFASNGLCHACAVRLRYEGTIRAVEAEAKRLYDGISGLVTK